MSWEGEWFPCRFSDPRSCAVLCPSINQLTYRVPYREVKVWWLVCPFTIGQPRLGSLVRGWSPLRPSFPGKKSITNKQTGPIATCQITLSPCCAARFYGGFHAVKYVVRVARDEDDELGNALIAGVGVLVPLVAVSATFRRNFPYAALLIGLDLVNNMSLQ